MLHHRMVTVTDKYMPLTGSGRNTIRKMSDKYRDMRPGDTVSMDYGPADAEKVDIEPFAREELVVASMAVASFKNILLYHVHSNHGETWWPDDMRKFFVDCYGDFEDDTEFVAIYFQ